MKKKILLYFFAFLLLFFHIGSANAQEKLEIFPKIIDEKMQARGISKYKIKLKNAGERKVSIYPAVSDLSVNDGMKEILDPNRTDKTVSLSRWITLKRGVIDLMPGEEMELDLEIEVNLSALPGKYFAAISFLQGMNKNEAMSKLSSSFESQILVNVEVEEKIVENAQLKGFSALKNIFFKFPVDFLYEIENFGNRTVTPEGLIYIYNRRGEEVGTISIGGPETTIKEGEFIKNTVSWSSGDSFGKYKAKLELKYGEKEKRDLQDTVYFWLLPFKFLIIFSSTVFFFLVILIYFIFKKTYHPHHYAHQQLHNESNGVINLRDE